MSFLPEGAVDKINEACLDFTTKFSQYMLLGYFEVAINKAKLKAEEKSDDDPEQLLTLPEPDWTIKSGWLTKEGGNYHSWKKRYFVARNQKDSFVVEYYSSDKCLEKEKKGYINCSGYSVKKDNSKKPFGITLTPHDSERRPWHIACETEQEQSDWMAVFENATWHARPTGDPDPMTQEAFEVAFNKLRTAIGFSYSISFDRSPAEMLTKLLVMDLDREVLRDIISEVSTPGGIGVTMARNTVRTMLVKSCAAACTTAWSGSKPAIDLAKTVVEEKVIPGIQPIIDAQVQLRDKIVGLVGSVTSPVTDKLRDTLFSPLLGMVLGPMGNAFKAAIKGFNTQMTARIEKGESLKDDSVFQDLISDVGYSYYSGSPMVDAYQIIRDLDETALGKFCDALPGVSSWSFIYKLDSMLRDLLRNAIYTCHKFSLDMEPAAALAKTLAQLVHDAKLCFCAVITNGIQYMIGDFFDENLIQPCVELVKPISDEIPEAFKTLLSVEGLLEEALNMTVNNAIEACTSGGAKDSAGSIDTWSN